MGRRAGSTSDMQLAPDARQVFVFAPQGAQRMGYDGLNTAHPFIGLTKIGEGCTARPLQQQGMDPKRLRDHIRQALTVAGPPREVPLEFHREMLSSRLPHVPDRAAAEARAAKASSIDESHLLCAFLQAQGGSTARLLRSRGVDLEGMRVATEEVRGGKAQPTATPLPGRLGRDLTAEACQDRLKPLIGRQREMARVAQVLARADKNTPAPKELS